MPVEAMASFFRLCPIVISIGFMRNASSTNYILILARYGSFSIGSVYVAIGVIALLSLLRLKNGGADEDSLVEDLNTIILGKIFLWLLLLGIASYIVWRIFEAITDPFHYGNALSGIARRIGIVCTALVYALVAWSGIQAMLGMADSAEGFEEQRHLVADVLGWRGGQWIIGAAGLVVAVAGILEFRYVVKGDHKAPLERLPEKKRKLVHVLAWAGHLARAIILSIIGYSLIRGATLSDAAETVNTDKAFNFIGESLLGHPLFVLVAVGTICYGVFMMVYGRLLDLKNLG